MVYIEVLFWIRSKMFRVRIEVHSLMYGNDNMATARFIKIVSMKLPRDCMAAQICEDIKYGSWLGRH